MSWAAEQTADRPVAVPAEREPSRRRFTARDALGAVVSVRDSRLGPPEPRPMMRMTAAAVEAVPIEAGELSVEAIVDVEFTFEQG